MALVCAERQSLLFCRHGALAYLNLEWFTRLREARQVIEEWCVSYNGFRTAGFRTAGFRTAH